MIRIETVRNFYPAQLRDNALFSKYILKEYLQLLILDYISTTPYIRKITFIGGTSIRLIKGIDRFSEDLDFDCKDLSHEEFTAMTDGIVQFIRHFYDAMFLLSQTMPDFDFLSRRTGVSNLDALKEKAENVISSVDLRIKMKDFEHLLFNKQNSTRILRVAEFFQSL